MSRPLLRTAALSGLSCAAAILAILLALPTQDAAAGDSDDDAQQDTFLAWKLFSIPSEGKDGYERRWEFDKGPVFAVLPWSLVSYTHTRTGPGEPGDGGVSSEVGVEFGLHVRTGTQVAPFLTTAFGVGFDVVPMDASGRRPGEGNPGAGTYSINLLTGIDVALGANNQGVQVAFWTRWTQPWAALRYPTGDGVLGLDGLGSWSIGLVVRWVFYLSSDVMLPAGGYFQYDLSNGAREMTFGVDFGAAAIVLFTFLIEALNPVNWIKALAQCGR